MSQPQVLALCRWKLKESVKSNRVRQRLCRELKAASGRSDEQRGTSRSTEKARREGKEKAASVFLLRKKCLSPSRQANCCYLHTGLLLSNQASMGLIKGVVNLVAAIASFFVTGLAIAITVYTAVKLADVSWNPLYISTNGADLGNLTSTSFCALGKQSTTFTVGELSFDTASISNDNCLFIEILGGCTIGLGIVIGIIQCYTCHLCGLGGILDFIFAAAGAAAWCVASIMVTNVYKDGNDSDNPAVTAFNDERKAVMIMSWVEFGLFASIIVAAVLKCLTCCGGRTKN